MVERAFIEVRVFPWRLRARVMTASTRRGLALNADPVNGDDVAGFVVVLRVWLAILIARCARRPVARGRSVLG